jgi:hypothetical protein
MEHSFFQISDDDLEKITEDVIDDWYARVANNKTGVLLSILDSVILNYRNGLICKKAALMALVLFDTSGRLDIPKKLVNAMRPAIERSMQTYDIFTTRFAATQEQIDAITSPEPPYVHDIRLILGTLKTIALDQKFVQKSKLKL